MLRSFEVLRETAQPEAFIAGDDRLVVLQGGGTGYARPWHWHDCLMLILPEIGALDLHHEKRPAGRWLSKGQFAVVPAGIAHETCASRDTSSHVVFYLTTDALSRLEGDMGSLERIHRLGDVLVFDAGPDIRSLQALCRTGAKGPGRRSVLSHVSDALLIRCLSVILTTAPQPLASNRDHGTALVSEIRAHLELRPQDEVSLDAVAERFGVSRRHLTRMFRQRTGQSIGEYRLNVRLQTARQLLAETNLPIGEIAVQVGFEESSALSRALRRNCGLSPREVRTSVARSGAS